MHGARWPKEVSRLLGDHRLDRRQSFSDAIEDEIVGVEGDDAERFENAEREVSEVERDDDRRLGAHSGGQDVAVVRIR